MLLVGAELPVGQQLFKGQLLDLMKEKKTNSVCLCQCVRVSLREYMH